MTLEEIKNAYRRLASQYHPDKLDKLHKKEGEALFKRITEARDVILNYCAHYRYSFKKEDVENVRSDQDFEHDFIRQFYDDWLIHL